jgi:hypothetical protein
MYMYSFNQKELKLPKKKSMPKKRNKYRLNIYLEFDQKDNLEKLHETTGAPISELIRRAITAYLDSRRKEIK